MKNQQTLQDTLIDLRGDVTLLRLCLRALLDSAKGRSEEELCCLWRLSDYLEQHVGEVESLLQNLL